MNPAGLQSQMFWELISQVPILKVWETNVGELTFALLVEVPGFDFSPKCGLQSQG